MTGDDDQRLYRLARATLLDALDALGVHREAITLVGAQAIYARVGEADFAVAPYTTDADLIIDPRALGEIPPLESALKDAGFDRRSPDVVGAWTRTARHGDVSHEIDVDLMVPTSVSPRAGRAAGLQGHDLRAARNVDGLDGALEDRDRMAIGALANDGVTDTRTFEIQVAGPAALLVAKLHKIRDRASRRRSSDKDALDVLRLLRGTRADDLRSRYERLLEHALTSAVARAGIDLLEQQFGAPGAVGNQMMVRAVGALTDEAEVAVLLDSSVLLTTELIASLR